jgi:polyhydroxybutyrate depolymerase
MFLNTHMRTLLLTLLLTASPAIAGDWGDLTPPDDVPVYLPPDYNPDDPTPLLIFLHGWAPISPVWYDVLVPIQDDANAHGYLFAKPVGSQDIFGDYFWNATDACCDMFGADPPHVSYLLALVQSIQAHYNVDPQRIHLLGQSNGGFMCHRMACEAPETFASVVSLSGALWNDQSVCQPSEPIHVLNIHGTLDPIIFWLGGYLPPNLTPYPGVETTAAFWAAHNGCSTNPTNLGNFDFDLAVAFSETTRWVYEPCDYPAAGSTELWQTTLGSHFPIITAEGTAAIFDYLDTHTKPVATCLADLTGDGIVDVLDLLDLLAFFGTDEGDIDGDGIADVSDLLLLLAHWGPCT